PGFGFCEGEAPAEPSGLRGSAGASPSQRIVFGTCSRCRTGSAAGERIGRRIGVSTPAGISHNKGCRSPGRWHLRRRRNLPRGRNGMKSHRVGEGERSLAVFIDFENMGLGFNNRRDRFEINKVLERLVEKGKIVAKKAYADWSRFGMYTGGLHEAAIELVEIPRRGVSGKNSADIRLVVDAIDLDVGRVLAGDAAAG